MALASQQKAVIELSNLTERTNALLTRLGKMAPHPLVDAAIAELEKLRGPVMRAHEQLIKLPPTYSAHASKIATSDIGVGSIVAIRDAHRAKYVNVLSGDEMNHLEVTALGASCAVQTRGGVRLLVARGHIVTSGASIEEGTYHGTAQ